MQEKTIVVKILFQKVIFLFDFEVNLDTLTLHMQFRTKKTIYENCLHSSKDEDMTSSDIDLLILLRF